MACSKNSRSKRQKFENKGADMLNDVLPEELVSNILSRLSTKEAIKTSILSKRWRFLWTTISNLDFSDDREVNRTFYDQDGNFVDKSKRNAVYLKNFKRYVNSVMLRLHPTTSIDKFSISLEKYSDVLHIEKWISSVVERNVKDLTLSLETCHNNPIDVPLDLFDSKLLESLRLDHGLHLKIPQRGFVSFPNLKFLSLEYVSISGIPAQEKSPCFPNLRTLCLKVITYEGKDDSVMKLIRNCPLLEDVSIRRIVRNNVSYIDMCIPQLTTADLFCVPDQNIRLKVQIEAQSNILNFQTGTRPTKSESRTLIL
jgi:hypothetical protein